MSEKQIAYRNGFLIIDENIKGQPGYNYNIWIKTVERLEYAYDEHSTESKVLCKIVAATSNLNLDVPETVLNTNVLPQYNCSNCKYFKTTNQEITRTTNDEPYAYECSNLVHPLLDCVLRGFKGHSEQPGMSQTLNK